MGEISIMIRGWSGFWGRSLYVLSTLRLFCHSSLYRFENQSVGYVCRLLKMTRMEVLPSSIYGKLCSAWRGCDTRSRDSNRVRTLLRDNVPVKWILPTSLSGLSGVSSEGKASPSPQTVIFRRVK